jgi:hypothetical protein
LKDQPADETIHVDVAIEITRALFNREMESEFPNRPFISAKSSLDL